MIKIPIGISGRHVHVTKDTLIQLFGPDYELTFFKSLSQPGQFAANEKVKLISPSGKELDNVRILGPVRKFNQVEISNSDAIRGGFTAPVRSSGDVRGSGRCTIVGPAGAVRLPDGVIIADRHIHITPALALLYEVKDGDRVKLRVAGAKGATLNNVLIRVSEQYALEAHLDTDDGAALMLVTGVEGFLSKR
ncbi:Phosphate propanoyltransferase [termite gut metagenome]|uniref:Phosphate propanoyltransferase n=1 Tax=termite gut metagenome TaxID=433724 RepID=A0A5J4RC90_9ZZZZ